MDGIPFLLLFLAALALIYTYAWLEDLIWQFTVVGVLLTLAMAFLPSGPAQLVPWTVLLATAARAGRLLVIRQNQQADR